MICPNCFKKSVTIEHLRESEECSRVAASFCALYRASKRITPPKAGPGRPKKAKSDILAKSENARNFTRILFVFCSVLFSGLPLSY